MTGRGRHTDESFVAFVAAGHGMAEVRRHRPEQAERGQRQGDQQNRRERHPPRASQVAVAVFSVGTRNCEQGADLFLEQRPGGPVEARWQLIKGSRAEGVLEINDRADPPIYTVDLC